MRSDDRSDLLSSLYRRGVRIWVENGQLRFQAPKGALLPEELARLRMFKNEIVGFLLDAPLAPDIPLEPRAAGYPAPLTAIQLRVWNYTVEKAARLSTRASGFAERIHGPLSTCILRESIEAVVRRHESLRTRFALADGVPTHIINSSCEFDFEVIDCRQLPPGSAESAIQCHAQEFLKEKVDLSVGPLFAVKLFRLSSCEHVLVLALDHMITDAVSNGILIREIWALYNQASQGSPLSLPTLSVQFADYAVWQQRTYSAWLDKNGAYWRKRLSHSPRTRLPCDVGLGEVAQLVGATLEISIGEELSIRLRDVARRQGTLLSLIVLTVYVAAMWRWCNEDDLVVGFVSNGRYRPELENVIGFVADILYLRIELHKQSSVLDLLNRIIFEFKSAYDHYDFGRVPDLIPECWTELYFNWLSRYRVQSSVECDGRIRVEPFRLAADWPAKFAPFFYDTNAGIRVTVMYRPDLIPRSMVEQFGRNLRCFAEVLVERPSASVASIVMPI